MLSARPAAAAASTSRRRCGVGCRPLGVAATASTPDPYRPLFQPLQLGPVTAPNRFYQAPHCNGLGHVHPSAIAGMRGVKAEGGWGVVCTEECEVHPASDVSPYVEARLWDAADEAPLRRSVDAIHAHGSLAGIELVFAGPATSNRVTRLPVLAASTRPVARYDPVHARAMDTTDIARVREWHRAAAVRAMRIGFDVVTVYAGHGLSILQDFLSRRHNHRTDEYGGSLDNRVRLLRQVLTDTKAAVGHRCAVALRLAVDDGDLIRSDDEGREIVAALAGLPDLFDVNISGWERDSATFRFQPEEGGQLPFMRWVKEEAGGVPVVGVGRYTSPDTMAGLLSSGVLDMIGAARPSIADPFLPRKIAEGRVEDIRECIGCNVCVSGDMTMAPIRCTQNPTMGVEWRHGWHPERVQPYIVPPARHHPDVLVVGAGPAGLECAVTLGRRGCSLVVAEQDDAPGGRIRTEAALPGLASYQRVVDYRVGQLAHLPHVDVYYGSHVTEDMVRELAPRHVVVATGARWRRDGVGRQHGAPLAALTTRTTAPPVVTFDDLLQPDVVSDVLSPGCRVVVYDDDHGHLPSAWVTALHASSTAACRRLPPLLAHLPPCDVTLVTPAVDVAHWTHNTLEQRGIQRQLLQHGVSVVTNRALHEPHPVSTEGVVVECVYTGATDVIAADVVVVATSRVPRGQRLYASLAADPGGDDAARSVECVGDAFTPGTVAAAVYDGHRYGQGLTESGPACRWHTPGATDTMAWRREPPRLAQASPSVD